MSRIVILGSGVIGLCMGLMLRRDGHDVTVLERDRDPLPSSAEEAWHRWPRRGVAQFRQAHYLQPAGRLVLAAQLPEVEEALRRAGGTTFEVLTLLPPSIEDRAPREGDERFATITGRRPVVEYAVARVAEARLEVRRGTPVRGLLTGSSAAPGIPHVTGVRTVDGETISADLVIDAMGRGSMLADWLEAVGGRRPIEEAEDAGFVYYTRYFRSRTGDSPPFRTGLLTHFESFSLLTLPGDAGTWSVTVYISARDQALKRLHDLGPWTALVAACPLQAHLLDGEPLTDILALGGVLDRYRRFVVDGAPVATGTISVGDSWACTNPSLGRGIAMGLMHAEGARGVIREHLGDPLALVRAHDETTETRMTPWYRQTIELDRARVARINAVIAGQPVPESTDPAARMRDAFVVAMRYDADLFRAFAEITGLLALPREVLGRPGIVESIVEVARTHEALAPPGPSRHDILRMLG